MSTARKLSVAEKIGFGMGDAACGIVYSSVTMFLTYFYTDIYGLSAAAVGIMFLVTRVLDAITDPLTGLVADRVHTRWGHFRPWLIWFAIPYAVLAVLTFSTPDFGESGKLLYAYITYTLLMLCYTFINIPYCALGGVITTDEKDRLSAQSYRFTISSLAGLVVSVATLFLVDWLGKENKQFGFQATMAIMGTLAVIMLFFCFFSTSERVRPKVEINSSMMDDLRILLANDQWRIVAVITFFSSMAGVMRSAATLYYATYLMLGGIESAAGTAMKSAFVSTSVVGTIIGSIAAGYLAQRYRAVSLFKNINLLLVVIGVVMFFVPPTWLAIVFPLYFLVGFFHQMYQPFKWNMMANAADYGEWKFGRRITGLSFSGNLFALKMGMAVAGAFVGFSLGWFGYQAGNPTQTTLATNGIIGLLTIGPSISYLVLYWLSRFYILDDKMMNQIQRDLAHREQVEEINTPAVTPALISTGANNHG
ncbi:putative GPH family arabinoside transporter [Buttiauxella brennerae ATCC 51605]|uniref:Putative GPH family arabinoside transporter n=1 Tax=Buttiauxella brennerae ATCC 51605 TaxID=1354251 RepID=A0A1B7IWY3_9ENTR|nr:glycoside-pentoside-hexuronide (GPH):cation symporter [Buttiauxella brennerae]OAT34446.1 putative GPH family arabinoside transporter [Buttiauxella brennerae ATCC 51605]